MTLGPLGHGPPVTSRRGWGRGSHTFMHRECRAACCKRVSFMDEIKDVVWMLLSKPHGYTSSAGLRGQSQHHTVSDSAARARGPTPKRKHHTPDGLASS